MAMLDLWPINTHLPSPGMLHSFVVALLVLSPFPFYWYLWTYPRKWLKMCEGVDPSHRMAQVAHLLKALQVVGLLSVATFSVPPIICVALFGLGQFLNYRYMSSRFTLYRNSRFRTFSFSMLLIMCFRLVNFTNNHSEIFHASALSILNSCQNLSILL